MSEFRYSKLAASDSGDYFAFIAVIDLDGARVEAQVRGEAEALGELLRVADALRDGAEGHVGDRLEALVALADRGLGMLGQGVAALERQLEVSGDVGPGRSAVAEVVVKC